MSENEFGEVALLVLLLDLWNLWYLCVGFANRMRAA